MVDGHHAYRGDQDTFERNRVRRCRGAHAVTRSPMASSTGHGRGRKGIDRPRRRLQMSVTRPRAVTQIRGRHQVPSTAIEWGGPKRGEDTPLDVSTDRAIRHAGCIGHLCQRPRPRPNERAYIRPDRMDAVQVLGPSGRWLQRNPCITAQPGTSFVFCAGQPGGRTGPTACGLLGPRMESRLIASIVRGGCVDRSAHKAPYLEPCQGPLWRQSRRHCERGSSQQRGSNS